MTSAPVQSMPAASQATASASARRGRGTLKSSGSSSDLPGQRFPDVGLDFLLRIPGEGGLGLFGLLEQPSEPGHALKNRGGADIYGEVQNGPQ